YGVATFYALFATEPRPPRIVHVCTDIACNARGAGALCAELERRLGPARGPLAGPGAGVGVAGDEGADPAGMQWQESPCIGMCEHAPVALAIEAGDPPREQMVTEASADAVIDVARHGPADRQGAPPPAAAIPQQGDPALVLLRRIGAVDPSSLDDYRAADGYLALRRAFELGPAGVIDEVGASKLSGRGGAAFPTGIKWKATASQPALPHYLVCNADESEPGTFKDRVIMEGDPYAVVEAMTVAAYATGCELGYLYIRGEYPSGARALRHAIDEARAHGLLGADIMGRGFCFDIEIRRGAGAYICGEETALFNSIEGRRGEPRAKPPLPVEKGLFGKPTVVNNVETLVDVLQVLLVGAPAFAAIGTEKSTGTRLFCLSGTVRRPGIYELPFGTSLRDLLDLAGGVPDGRTLRAILLGGAAGGFVGPDELDLQLSFEATREAGTTLGSGVVIVLDDTVQIADVLLRIAAFFRDESCGQCVPCRVGTVRQEEALRRLVGDRPLGSRDDDITLLREVGRAMRDASICGLGQTAWNAVESAIDRLGIFTDRSGDAAAHDLPIRTEDAQ
ncbi:MAG: NADH-ubiquinone oxidoreductase-F iron-sulfur binding region domain-containing protein, partial [Mycobacteriales bacterium]